MQGDLQGDAGVSAQTTVQEAVERFVERHGVGDTPDLDTFAADYPIALRAEIVLQCREFLAFDGLLGHQEWTEPPPEATHDGRRFGDFLIQEELGRGGMGVVYLARQLSLNRRVALKVMASGLTLSKRHVERFRREAAASAQLRHPAIVPVHSLTEVDGTFALAMDYVAGRNVADILDDLRLGNDQGEGVAVGSLGIAPDKGYVAECAMFAAQIASALATAHAAGVVHRDLKPRNLMLDDRRQARLLDFGLAKSLDDEGRGGSISMSGEITGTAHYLSPEQTLAKRVAVDHRVDIWALGVILYELLTLQRPFDGKNLQQIVYEICFKEPVPLQRRNPKVPRDLVTIVQKALEKDPQNRYQTAAEFEADLQRFLSWEPIHARPASAWTRFAKFLRRHRTETAIGGTALLAASAVLVTFSVRGYLDGSRADALLVQAEARAGGGDFDAAIDLANRALELRNDEATRARLAAYHAENKRIPLEAALKVAQSKQLLDHDREGALLLALDAEQLRSDELTRSAVLDALGSGWSVRTLPTPRGLACVTAAWSPDGDGLLTAGFGGLLQYFASDSEKEPLLLNGHDPRAPVIDAAFAGRRRLLSVSPDRTLRIWDLDGDGEPLVVSLDGQATALRTDANGRRALVVTAAPNGPFAATVHDAGSGRPLAPPMHHDSLILASALSDDGLLCATSSGAVRLWRTDDATLVAEWSEHLRGPDRGQVRALRFSPDGALCAVGCSDGSVRLYATADGALLATEHHSRDVTSIAFDPASRRMLTGSRDNTARLWNVHRDGARVWMREDGVLGRHGAPVQHVAFDATGRLAVTGSASPDGQLRVFDVGGEEHPSAPIRSYEVGTSVEHAEFAADGRRILAVARGRAVVWNFGTARGVVTVSQLGPVAAAALVHDGQQLLTAGDDEQLRLWQARDGRLVWATAKCGNPLQAIDVDPGEERVACALVGGKVSVHRLRDGELLFGLDGHHGSVPVVRFTAEGTRLLTAGGERRDGEARESTGRVVLWNTTDQSPVARFELPAAVIAADVRQDGGLLATIEQDATEVKLWSLPDGVARGTIAGQAAPLRCVRFAPDGRSLLTGGEDQQARLWSLDGKLLQAFAARGVVQCVGFAPDGDLVLTGGNGSNAVAQLWRVADGAEVLHFGDHRGSITSATFAATGQWAATSSRNGTSCIWPTDPVAVARRLPLRRRDATASPTSLR
ncbi:MAG: protein kinase [Planctomycetes bacterium]|nr:protein kinase [Planctomycetota bacterium]